MNRIAIITLDGGAGKTAISYAIAKDLGFYIISNDDSVIESIYPTRAKIMKQPNLIDNVVYDFGGFVDTGVVNIIQECDLIIVPCVNDINSKMKAIKTITQLKKYANNFLIVATKIENQKELTEIKASIQKVFNEIPILPLRKTKLFKNALEYAQSPLELENESKLTAHSQRNILSEYKALLNYIEKELNL